MRRINVLFVAVLACVALLSETAAADLVQNTLTDLSGGSLYSEARGLNDSGQVVGYFLTSGGAYHAFRTAANSAINAATDDLGTLGGSGSTANGINNRGWVVGDASTGNDVADHAFMFNGSTMEDLGTLGGRNSVAYGINGAGDVVGQSELGGVVHAFLRANDQMVDLGTLGGRNSVAKPCRQAGVARRHPCLE